MATAVSIDSVTTEDAAPTTAPHRISSVTGKKTVTFKFTPTTTDASNIRAWLVRFGGASRTTGTRLAGLGMVCGLWRCGLDRPLSIASGFQVTVDEDYPELPSSADGTYAVNVYAISDTQGWNP
ncbi:MAG: hypothetical protein QOF36_2551 [Microbacteriaceae bacterium]|jgi:hypothetical protein|nr:hypothetical protein [Microbacteriaceae bacterium]